MRRERKKRCRSSTSYFSSSGSGNGSVRRSYWIVGGKEKKCMDDKVRGEEKERWRTRKYFLRGE